MIIFTVYILMFNADRPFAYFLFGDRRLCTSADFTELTVFKKWKTK